MSKDVPKPLETRVMTFGSSDKEYDYVLCGKCGVWVQAETYEEHYDSEECRKHESNREMRERAFKNALGALNKIGRSRR